jgi:hypothetical protein
MQTRIIIRHDDVAALKASPLWAAIMDAFMSTGAVSVEEIAEADDADEAADAAQRKGPADEPMDADVA